MCGIFGYLGSQSSRFDLDKFNILGIYNDSRGKDSVGFYAKTMENEYIHKGVTSEKLWVDFMIKRAQDLNGMRFENPNVVLGHCRKASVGAITIAQAQPVEVRDEDGNVVMVGIHNGTLLNYKELAEKYNFEYPKEWTDSQIFINLIYHNGFDLLKEYNGAGAFVFYFPDRGDVYIFKGYSRNYDYVNGQLSEERPLYMLTMNDHHYFSSIEDSLIAISGNYMWQENEKHELVSKKDVGIVNLDVNHLYHFNNGILLSKTEYDRKAMYQLGSSNYGSGTYNANRGNYWEHNDYIYGSNNSHQGRRSGQYNRNNSRSNTNNISNNFTSMGVKITSEQIKEIGLYDLKHNIIKEESNIPINCLKIHDGILQENIKGSLHICDGMYVFDRYSGLIISRLMKPELMIDNIKATTLFAYNGVIVKDFNHYVALHSLQSLLYSYIDMNRDLYINDVINYSDYPIYDKESNIVIGIDKETNGWALYNGIYTNIVDIYCKMFIVEDGTVQKYCYDYKDVLKLKNKNNNHYIDLVKNTKYFTDAKSQSVNYCTFIKNLIKENSMVLYSTIVSMGATEEDINNEIKNTLDNIQKINNK